MQTRQYPSGGKLKRSFSSMARARLNSSFEIVSATGYGIFAGARDEACAKILTRTVTVVTFLDPCLTEGSMLDPMWTPARFQTVSVQRFGWASVFQVIHSYLHEIYRPFW
jgi:hypothetical protein